MRFSFGEYQLDTEARSLQQSGQAVHVEPKAFDLLVYLIEHRERVASPDELLEALWPGTHVGSAALSAAVHKAREAVGDDGDQQAVLRTKHGHGFRFVAEVSVVAAPEAALPTTTRYRIRFAATAGVVALLLAVTTVWLLNRPGTELAPIRSIAVLPFANLSQDTTHEPFTNGIYDDILTQIAKIRDLKVIARTSMERLDPNLTVQEIGTKLGVAAVLEGGVQRIGNRVRINVQLIDCETEAHLWAETYDRGVTAANIFAIQREIAMSVADALRATLSEEEQDSIASTPTENFAAYQAYLLGKQRMAKYSLSAEAEATVYFQQAIEHDPSFALAYVGLADSYSLWAHYGGSPRDEALAKAQAAMNKALELDDRLGEAHTSLAGIKEVRGDLEGAEAAYRRALKLNPNYAMAYEWYGDLLRDRLGRVKEALPLHLRAVELDPLSAVMMTAVAWDLHFLGRFAESLAWFEKAIEADPSHRDTYLGIGSHYLQASGRLDEAVVWYMKAISLFSRDPLPLGPGEPDYLSQLGSIFLNLGDFTRAEYWFEKSAEFGAERFEPRNGMMFLHLYRGNETAMVDHARRLLADFPSSSQPLMLLRNHELKAGRYAEARRLYEKAHPELLRDDPEVGRTNFGEAHDLALVLLKTGETELADLLLKRSLEYIQTQPRLGLDAYKMMAAQIFALQGKKQEALSAIRQAVYEGYHQGWRYNFEHEPNIELLRGELEFQTIREEVRTDMAAQLERVREMERSGELAVIPRD